jgi:hypothetical protein
MGGNPVLQQIVQLLVIKKAAGLSFCGVWIPVEERSLQKAGYGSLLIV